MNLHKTVSTLTIIVLCISPLAFTAGCTGPPRSLGSNATGNDTNTSQSSEIDNSPYYSDVYSNTTN